MQIERENIKLSLLADDIIVYVESPKELGKKEENLLELIREYGKVPGYR